MIAATRRSRSIPVVMEAISRRQSRVDVVCLPAVVHDPACFRVAVGTVIDATRTTLLAKSALAGLLVLARHGPVRFRLLKNSQPYELLNTLPGGALRPSLYDPDEWELVCPA